MPTRKPRITLPPLQYSRLTPHPTRKNVWVGRGHNAMWLIEQTPHGALTIRQAGSPSNRVGTYIPTFLNTLALVNFWLRQDEHCQRFTHRSTGPR